MQTTYEYYSTGGRAGRFYTKGNSTHIKAFRNNTLADMPWGTPFVHDAGSGTTDFAVRPFAGATEVILGFSVYSAEYAPQEGFNAIGIRPNGMFDGMLAGELIVPTEQAIVAGDPVYVRFGPGTDVSGLTDIGSGSYLVELGRETPVAWVKNTAVIWGALIFLAGKVYQVVTAGTTQNSDTPSLIGSTSADATDGTAHMKYLGALEHLSGLRKDADTHTAWPRNTAVALGVRRWLVGKVYQCITAGTTEDSATPALIGSTSADATDGTAHWKYIGVSDAAGATAVLLPGARWYGGLGVDPSIGAAAGSLAVLGLNLPY